MEAENLKRQRREVHWVTNEGKEEETNTGLGQTLPLESQEETGFDSAQSMHIQNQVFIESKRIQTGPIETNKWDGR